MYDVRHLFVVYFVNDLETINSDTNTRAETYTDTDTDTRRKRILGVHWQNSNRHLHEFVASLTIIWLDSSWRHKPLVYLLTRHEHETQPFGSLSLSHFRPLSFMSSALAIKVYWFGCLLGAICKTIPIYRVDAHAEQFDVVNKSTFSFNIVLFVSVSFYFLSFSFALTLALNRCLSLCMTFPQYYRSSFAQ